MYWNTNIFLLDLFSNCWPIQYLLTNATVVRDCNEESCWEPNFYCSLVTHLFTHLHTSLLNKNTAGQLTKETIFRIFWQPAESFRAESMRFVHSDCVSEFHLRTISDISFVLRLVTHACFCLLMMAGAHWLKYWASFSFSFNYKTLVLSMRCWRKFKVGLYLHPFWPILWKKDTVT